MINWKTDAITRELIEAIAKRGMSVYTDWNIPIRLTTIEMNITACHLNGCPLRLVDLLISKDCDFAHDIWGIGHNLDRDTGKLLNCFLPRHARPTKGRRHA
jgi:hypothetical protein